jgi:hypothetical protein
MDITIIGAVMGAGKKVMLAQFIALDINFNYISHEIIQEGPLISSY